LFSKEYINQLKYLHYDKSRPRGFGGKVKPLGQFEKFMKEWNVGSLLDYGCGKGFLLAHLRETYPTTKVYGYDPAVDMFKTVPGTQFDCVFSNDVLEHIEPEYISNVLQHINQLAEKYVWLRIDTLPARKRLPDGRNAHLILESDDWWYNMIERSIKGNIVYAELNKKGKFDVAIEKR
jgi:SAM-dependent methyltransferase